MSSVVYVGRRVYRPIRKPRIPRWKADRHLAKWLKSRRKAVGNA